MESTVVETAVDIRPFISIITYLIICCFVIVIVLLLRGALIKGIAHAIADYLLTQADDEARQKMCRWFGNGPAIYETLRALVRKIDAAEAKMKTRV